MLHGSLDRYQTFGVRPVLAVDGDAELIVCYDFQSNRDGVGRLSQIR
jgi:hypothetical protein